MGERVSLKPSEAEAGGQFGFPVGSTVVIDEAQFTTWAEAGESALKGGREADDPALKIVGTVDGEDDARPPVFLGAGKAARTVPSDDGEFLEKAEGASTQAISESTNIKIFFDSIFYKDKTSPAFKKHGKMAVQEDVLEDGITAALVGLKFVVGSFTPEGTFGDGAKRKPVPIAEEIIEKPTGKPAKAAGKKAKAKAKPAADDDDDDDDADDEPVAKKKAGAGKKKASDEPSDEVVAAAEKGMIKALKDPKNRKGILATKAYTAVFAKVKEEDEADAIMELIQDDDWMSDDDRPWSKDDDDMYQIA